ncbi:hypothetical protein DOY81_003026 [Sarcophaga bullata]|nr:hypothetical protein DOY81_003026 [Sarcophaga bullata]
MMQEYVSKIKIDKLKNLKNTNSSKAYKQKFHLMLMVLYMLEYICISR